MYAYNNDDDDDYYQHDVIIFLSFECICVCVCLCGWMQKAPKKKKKINKTNKQTYLDKVIHPTIHLVQF